jgi:16S rRNA (guanine1207-N2)-methyltransferase
MDTDAESPVPERPASHESRRPAAHYFDEQPTAAPQPVDCELALPDMRLRFTTDRGVFGYGRIDTGTTLLLQRGPQPSTIGPLLDVGCGVGPIAVTLARRAPAATVWAVDVNERARNLCAANARLNDVGDRVRVSAPDDVPVDLRFAEIWSNPPIRIGKAALHDLLLHWLARLVPGGVAYLVVQRHLGADSLQRWLSEGDDATARPSYPTERIGSAAGYRLLRVTLEPAVA